MQQTLHDIMKRQGLVQSFRNALNYERGVIKL